MIGIVAAGQRHAEGLRDGVSDPGHGLGLGEVGKPDSPGKAVRHACGQLHGQPCLAAAPLPGECDQREVRVGEPVFQFGQLLRTAHKAGRKRRQTGGRRGHGRDGIDRGFIDQLLQIVGQLGTAAVAPRRVLAETLEGDLFQPGRNRIAQRTWRRRMLIADGSQHDVHAWPGKGAAAGGEFVEHHAQAPDIGARIDQVGLSGCLLGTHIDRRPGEVRALPELRGLQRGAEIDDVRHALLVDQDVGRLDVAMDEPFLMRVLQPPRHLGQQLGDARMHQPPAEDVLVQVVALDPLGDHVAQAVVGGAHIVDRHDLWMVQPRGAASLLQIGRKALGSFETMTMRQLDRHPALELVVVGQHHTAKAPLPQQTFDPVAADRLGQLAGGRGWAQAKHPDCPTLRKRLQPTTRLQKARKGALHVGLVVHRVGRDQPVQRLAQGGIVLGRLRVDSADAIGQRQLSEQFTSR